MTRNRRPLVRAQLERDTLKITGNKHHAQVLLALLSAAALLTFTACTTTTVTAAPPTSFTPTSVTPTSVTPPSSSASSTDRSADGPTADMCTLLSPHDLQLSLGIPPTVQPVPHGTFVGNGCAWSLPDVANSTRIIELGDVSDIKRAPGQFGTCIPTEGVPCSFRWDNGPLEDRGATALVSGTTVVFVTAEEPDASLPTSPTSDQDLLYAAMLAAAELRR